MVRMVRGYLMATAAFAVVVSARGVAGAEGAWPTDATSAEARVATKVYARVS